MNISSIIITKNEEEQIVSCIRSLCFTHEVIVIDNTSSDETVKRAKEEGGKVYTVGGLDFSYLRNLGKEKAKGEWLLYIDADERVTKELAKEIKIAIKNEKHYCAFSLPRQNYYLGKLWPKMERMVRLIKKSALVGWTGSLHESPILVGEVGELSSHLLHFTHRNLSEMVKKTNEWSAIEAQLRYKSGHPKIVAWRLFRVMATTFWCSFVIEKGWQVGMTGFIESIYQAFSIFITYTKLWEKQQSV